MLLEFRPKIIQSTARARTHTHTHQRFSVFVWKYSANSEIIPVIGIVSFATLHQTHSLTMK